MTLRDEILNAVYEASRFHKEYDSEVRAKDGEGRVNVFGMLADKDIPVMFRPLKNLLGAYIDLGTDDDDAGQGVMVTTTSVASAAIYCRTRTRACGTRPRSKP